jgi:hypothetical protein
MDDSQRVGVAVETPLSDLQLGRIAHRGEMPTPRSGSVDA